MWLCPCGTARHAVLQPTSSLFGVILGTSVLLPEPFMLAFAALTAATSLLLLRC